MKKKSSRSSQEKQARIFAKQGYQAQSGGNLKFAIVFFDDALKADPNKPEYYLNRGQCYSLLKKYPKAIADFAKAEALNYKTDELYTDYALALLYDGNPKEALEYYAKLEQLLIKNKSSSIQQKIDLLLNRGLCYYRLGELDQAIANFEAAKKLNPSDISPLLKCGQIYFDSRDFIAAQKEYDQILLLKKKNILAALMRGTCLYQLNDYRACINVLKRVVILKPTSVNLYQTLYVLTCAHSKLGEDRDANQYIEMLLALAHSYVGIQTIVYPLLAKYYLYLKNDIPRAAGYLKNYFLSKNALGEEISKNAEHLELKKTIKYISSESYQAEIFLIGAVIDDCKGEHPNALKKLNKVFSLDKNNSLKVEELVAVIKILLNSKNFLKAKQFCDMSLDKPFNNGDTNNIYLYHALACYNLKLFVEANSSFVKAINLTPDLLENSSINLFMIKMHLIESHRLKDPNTKKSHTHPFLLHLQLKELIPVLPAPETEFYNWYKEKNRRENNHEYNRPRSHSAPAVPYFFGNPVSKKMTVEKKEETAAQPAETLTV